MFRHVQDVIPAQADLHAHMDRISAIGWEPMAIVPGAARKGPLDPGQPVPVNILHCRRPAWAEELVRQTQHDLRDATLAVIAKKRQEAPKAAWPILDDLTTMLKALGKQPALADAAANATGDPAGGLSVGPVR